MKNEDSNERIEEALAWCREHKLESKQLSLFDLQYQKDLKVKKELDKKEFKKRSILST